MVREKQIMSHTCIVVFVNDAIVVIKSNADYKPGNMFVLLTTVQTLSRDGTNYERKMNDTA